MQRPSWIRFATFLVWLLAAGSVVYWALKFTKGPAAPPSADVAAVAASAAGTGAADGQALAKGLGGGQASAANNPTLVVAAPSVFLATRFVLTGVVVQKNSRNAGVALIAVDGKPSRPYRVGGALADGIVLHSVSSGKAMLATGLDAPVGLTLELPQLTTALAGTAVAARPALPAAISAVAIPTPMATAATMATPAANPTAAFGAQGAIGQRPPRPLANRQREAEKEAARDQTGAPAQ